MDLLKEAAIILVLIYMIILILIGIGKSLLSIYEGIKEFYERKKEEKTVYILDGDKKVTSGIICNGNVDLYEDLPIGTYTMKVTDD